jgi:signal transduction histidine kinase
MRRPRPIVWLREHPLIADGILAVALTSMSVLFHLTAERIDPSDADPSALGVVITVAAIAPIALRRRRPIEVLAAVTIAQVAAELADVVGPGWIGVLVGLYSVAAHTSGRRRTRAAAFATVVLGAVLVSGLLFDEVEIGDVLASVFILVTGFVLGDNLQRRRLHAQHLVERAERAERVQEMLARQQVTEERTRIARELHDVVAHSVTTMIIQAAAARRTIASDPESASATLAELEHTGRAAMTELRRVLGVLREPGAVENAEMVPQPSVSDLTALAASADDLPIEMSIDDDVAELPAGVGLSAYRVVQEALTNVRRHAGPVQRVVVQVGRTPEGLVVEVDDDGRGASSLHNEAAPPGFGLAGMRERVTATGGDLLAGPRSGGGWRVRAVFPTGTGA